ncbi:four-carbon acid sugar kinase family protein [Shouchella sp. JSM 1781072]|uniref:four-carbon acid sugar kinase family protein n=1 Tax=Bacillaceae TaxID=186817 RepID=UPI0020D08DE8|nr:four-carbon acid sugar kinase family protein [Alkalihalobacillus sp. LMS6]UTR05402.1 four-carbon acid sugar kinase family protein [Alkalihalobacillus sp. LMS6]
MKVGVIADDLTGANASGVKLVKQGFQATTIVHSASLPENSYVDAVVMDTDSRYIDEAIASQRVGRAMKELQAWGADVFTKRIDSTFRGNIGAEIDEMLSHMAEDAISIVMPSFPESGRTMAGGYLLLDGVPLQETYVSKDPIAPITESFIPDLLAEKTRHQVGFVSLSTVMKTESAIETAIQKEITQGNRVIIVDAMTTEQIEKVALALTMLERQILCADPGPLTANYARAMLQQENQNGTILVSVGSATSLTGEQLTYLIEKTGSIPVYVDPAMLASYSSTWDEEVERATEAALEQAKVDRVLIVTTHKSGQKLVPLKAKAEQEGKSQDALAKRITDGLATISRKVLTQEQLTFAGCFTSGGDVTASVCALGRANGIALKDEVMPLAAYGTFDGGYFDGLPVVTKGGLIGDKKAIYECVKFIDQAATKIGG